LVPPPSPSFGKHPASKLPYAPLSLPPCPPTNCAFPNPIARLGCLDTWGLNWLGVIRPRFFSFSPFPHPFPFWCFPCYPSQPPTPNILVSGTPDLAKIQFPAAEGRPGSRFLPHLPIFVSPPSPCLLIPPPSPASWPVIIRVFPIWERIVGTNDDHLFKWGYFLPRCATCICLPPR